MLISRVRLPMQTNFFGEFAIITTLAAVCGTLLHRLKQPLVAAYLLVGLLINFFQIGNIELHGPLEFLPTIGIAFLLFLIGAELDLHELKQLGKSIVLAALAQISLTVALVAVIANLLGFSFTESVLLGFAVAFSSTIVVIKLLADKHEITTLHGKIALGILLLQDFVAIGLLAFISLAHADVQTATVPYILIAMLAAKTAVAIALLVLVMKYVMKRLFAAMATSQELLFLGAIAWCFLFIAFAQTIGLSLEIGAFLGGVSLATSPYRHQIAGRLKPLRDFFIAIFFIQLGLTINFSQFSTSLVYVLILCIIAVVVKPTLVMGILSMLRFRKYTNYQASTALSQISEFSVILMVTAHRAGLVGINLVSIVAVTTIVTIFISSILINQNAFVYRKLKRFLRILELKGSSAGSGAQPVLEHHVILIGVLKVGQAILDYLKKNGINNVLVVDYNPKVVAELEASGVPVLFGDISDPDVLEQLGLEKAALIISTIDVMKDNVTLLEMAKASQSLAVIIVSALNDEEEIILRNLGAHEVVVPLQLESDKMLTVVEQYLKPRKDL